METKNRILSKAQEICRNVGFRAMTLDDIASYLGISKKTIYQYFADKDELVDAVMDLEIEKNRIDSIKYYDLAENAIDEVFLSTSPLTEEVNKINPIVIFDLQKFYPKTYTKIITLKNDFLFTIIKNNLQRGIDEGIYEADIQIDIIAKLRAETILLPFSQEVFPASNYNFITINFVIIYHFLKGIATEKGSLLLNEYKLKYKI